MPDDQGPQANPQKPNAEGKNQKRKITIYKNIPITETVSLKKKKVT